MKRIFLYTSLTLTALALTATASSPEPCFGTILLTGMSNFQVRQVDSQTFVEFDFTGLHDICLADHSEVTGTTAGHLLQRTSVNGDLDLHFNEILSYGGGTLGYRGEASLRSGNWQSQVGDRRRGHWPTQRNPWPGNLLVHRPNVTPGYHQLCVRPLTLAASAVIQSTHQRLRV